MNIFSHDVLYWRWKKARERQNIETIIISKTADGHENFVAHKTHHYSLEKIMKEDAVRKPKGASFEFRSFGMR